MAEGADTRMMAKLEDPPFPRRPHVWRLRKAGLRDLLRSKGWGMRGAYAEKAIGGRHVVARTIEEQTEWVVCRFELKELFWAEIGLQAREFQRHRERPPIDALDRADAAPFPREARGALLSKTKRSVRGGHGKRVSKTPGIEILPTDDASELAAKLGSLPEVQDRIDLVGADYASSVNAFAKLDAWTLGELLGLDFDDTGEWSRRHFAYRQELSDVASEHPFAEYIHLLEGLVPRRRLQELHGLASNVRDGTDDLPLTSEEVALLREAYARDQAQGTTSGIDLCVTTLTSTSGVELDFEVCIGDGAEPFDAKSPYDLRQGGGFDSSGFVESS
jgi:hypothetical protein